MPTRTRGRPGRSKVLSLLVRLDTQRDGVLRFAAGFSVPFGGNLRERDVGIVKIGRKISGGFRSAEGGALPGFPGLPLDRRQGLLAGRFGAGLIEALDQGQELEVSRERTGLGLPFGPHRPCGPSVLAFGDLHDDLHISQVEGPERPAPWGDSPGSARLRELGSLPRATGAESGHDVAVGSSGNGPPSTH